MQVSCPHCNANQDVAPQYAGAAVACYRCGGQFAAPLPVAHQPRPTRQTKRQTVPGSTVPFILMGLFVLLPIVLLAIFAIIHYEAVLDVLR